MNKKVFFLLAVFFSLCSTALASTVKWLVKPQYDAISYFSSGVFKCKTNGKWQLIDTKGNACLPYEVDSITTCIDDYALVLEKEGENYKIKGFFVNSKRQFVQTTGDYYIGAYPYFSEGFLTVANPKTKLFGYINKDETLVIPFLYQQARPFIKGLASVEPKERKTIYIDKEGNRLKIKGFPHDKIVAGSSFNHNGEALIAYYGNDNAIINTEGKVVRKYERVGKRTPINPYDFSFEDSDNHELPKNEILFTKNNNVSVFNVNGVNGYRMGNDTLVPAQFNQVEPFINEYAIVSIGNKFGVLTIIDGGFSALWEYKPTEQSFVCKLQLPDCIEQQAGVKFYHGGKELSAISHEDHSYTVTPIIHKDDKEISIKIQVLMDGLILWEDEHMQNLNYLDLTIGKPVCDKPQANSDGIVRVKTVIINKSKDPVKVSASYYAEFLNTSIVQSQEEQYLTIPSNGFKPSYFNLNVEKDGDVKVTVEVKVDGKKYGEKTSIIKVKPFF